MASRPSGASCASTSSEPRARRIVTGSSCERAAAPSDPWVMVSPISASVAPSEPPDAARSPRWLLPALLLGFAVVLFARLGDAPVHRTAEVRVDRVSRHMLESGDWLVPRLARRS